MIMEKNIKEKSWLFAIVASVICLVVPVSAGIAVSVVKNNAKAVIDTSDTSAYTVQELYAGNGKFNKANVDDMLKCISVTGLLDNVPTLANADYIRTFGTSTSPKASGKSLIVTLGGLKWQVVYLSTNNVGQKVATLWLVDSGQFSGKTAPSGVKYSISSSGALTSTWSNGCYDKGDNFSSKYPSSMYGMSYIRAVTLNNGGAYWNGTSSSTNSSATATASQVTDGTHIFSTFTVAEDGDFNDLTDFIVRPIDMPYQNTSEGEGSDVIGYTLMNDSLAIDVKGYYINDSGTEYNFQRVEGYTNWGNDCLWLPSIQEMGYNDTKAGLWRVSINERGQTTNAYSWSRSSSHNTSIAASCVSPSGSSRNGNRVDLSYAVRPALHLNLESAVLSTAGNMVLASVDYESEDTVTVDKKVDSSSDSSPATFCFTGHGYYYVNKITIDGVAVDIDTEMTDFASISGISYAKYRAYRLNNKVYISLSNVTKNGVKVVASYSATPIKVISNNPTITFDPSTMYGWVKGGKYNINIYAGFEYSDNLALAFDGLIVPLGGASGSGTIKLDGVSVTYAHTIYGNRVSIQIRNLPLTAHYIYLDYYAGGMSGSVTTATSGASTTPTITSHTGTGGESVIVVKPTTPTDYVYQMTINGVEVPVEYYSAYVYGVGGAFDIKYVAPKAGATNTFAISLYNIFEQVNIVFYFQNSCPALKNPVIGGGTQISGTVVTATEGGEARIVGNDIASSEDDNETVTFVAVAYAGYEFAGWVNGNDEKEILGTKDKMSIKLTKSQINGKIVKALFTKITTSDKVNSATDDGGLSGLI